MFEPRTVSYGLMRIGGTVGFIGSAYLFLLFAHAAFGLWPPKHFTLVEYSRRDIVVAVAAAFAGLLGLLLGQAIGASIRVRSDLLSDVIDSAWHFAAQACLVWTIASGLVFGIALGSERSRQIGESLGLQRAVWLGVAFPALLGWALMILLPLVTRVLPFPNFGSMRMAVYLAPMALCAAAGIYEAQELGAPIAWGVPLGVTSFPIIATAYNLIRRDADRRRAT